MTSVIQMRPNRHETFAIAVKLDKQLGTSCSFSRESDSDSAISSISDDVISYSEDGKFGVHPGQANESTIHGELYEKNQETKKTSTMTSHRLRLPFFKEEAIGTYYHPAQIRREVFMKTQGQHYANMLRGQINNVSGTEDEIGSFAKLWIRFRLQALGNHQYDDYQLNRIKITYNTFLQNLTPKKARELCIISHYVSQPEYMHGLELHLSYNYDPSYRTLRDTSRYAYQGFYF